jgi:thiol-disulfide isomerase/thioredoxin
VTLQFSQDWFHSVANTRGFSDRLTSGIYIAAVMLGALLTPISGFCVEVGDAAPWLTLPELESGKPWTLQETTEKVVYIDFWASWCGPCRKSLPLYEEMRKEFEENQFVIVAINLDEDSVDAVQFLGNHPVSYTVLSDPDGSSANQWQIKAMPTSFLLNKRGVVVRSWAGFKPSHIAEIQNEVRLLLN